MPCRLIVQFPNKMRADNHKRFSLSCFMAVPLLIAWICDRRGEPPAPFHPVIWYGKLIAFFERHAPSHGKSAQLIYGCGILVMMQVLVWSFARLVQRLIAALTLRVQLPWLGPVLEGTLLKPFFALHMLVEASRAVRRPLEQQNLADARHELMSLVSRDRSQLDSELIAAAVIESLAENVSDSVVAPLFYYVLWGLPGAAFYRLCNTFDSMIGYHGRYEYLGKAAARMDDLLNVVPARLTAGFIIMCAPFYGGDNRQAWRIWRRDARKTESPNAGHPMSALAGALHVQLEKVGHYELGDREQVVTVAHIQQAEKMVRWVGGLAFLISALCCAGKGWWRRG